MRKSLFVGFSLLATTIATSFSTLPVSAWMPVEPLQGKFGYVGACEDVSQLDCIESISALIGGTWVSAQLTPRLYDPGSTLKSGRWVPNDPEPDWFGWFHREWLIPGLLNEDGNGTIQSQGTVASPGTIDARCSPLQPGIPCLPMLKINITASALDGFSVPYESGSQDCLTPDANELSPHYGKCVRQGHLQLGIKFRVVVRTSWLLPTIIVTKTAESRVTIEKLPQNGAGRVTVEGIPYKTLGLGPNVNYKTDPNSRASWNDVIIKIQLLDGRYWRNGTYSKCAELPSLVVADNTWSPNAPTFSASNGLELNVTNSHFDTDGVTPFEGRYNGIVPLSTASCLWGTNLNSKSQFIAEVVESSTGEKKAATTAVSVNATELKISASGFTFSSPTIRVNPVFPSATLSPKKLTIICKKGKIVKTITSMKPKCPTGFKKV